jgi:hypothetical protein
VTVNKTREVKIFMERRKKKLLIQEQTKKMNRFSPNMIKLKKSRLKTRKSKILGKTIFRNNNLLVFLRKRIKKRMVMVIMMLIIKMVKIKMVMIFKFKGRTKRRKRLVFMVKKRTRRLKKMNMRKENLMILIPNLMKQIQKSLISRNSQRLMKKKRSL